MSTCAPTRRHGAAERAGQLQTHLGPDTLDRFNNLPAVKIIGSRRRASRPARRSPPSSRSWPRSCGTTSATTGAARPTRRSRRRLGLARLRLRPDHGVPDPGRAVRALVAAARGADCRSRSPFGALLAIWLRGLDNDVYFQIGLVTLLGLAAKNAILIVEFASQRYQRGSRPRRRDGSRAPALPADPHDVARLHLRRAAACDLHRRGLGSRHSVGTGVIGGMLAATFLAIFFVPLFFRLLGES